MGLKKHTKSLEKIAYAATIVVLLLLLIPAIRGRRGELEKLSNVEPPLAMKVFSTGYDSIDSLLNEGIRLFGKGNYSEAARKLSKAHFHLSVMIREGQISNYPDELLLYLGLAQFYRGRLVDGARFLAEGEEKSPDDERYPWYLAHIYIAQGKLDRAMEKLEKVAGLGGEYEKQARLKLKKLARITK